LAPKPKLKYHATLTALLHTLERSLERGTSMMHMHKDDYNTCEKLIDFLYLQLW
jgi:hypothetical protein